jgi:flavin-binding protein dodecin
MGFNLHGKNDMDNDLSGYLVIVIGVNGSNSESFCDSLSEAVGWANDTTHQNDVVAVYEAVRGSDGNIEKLHKVMGWIDDGYCGLS